MQHSIDRGARNAIGSQEKGNGNKDKRRAGWSIEFLGSSDV
jgi:hypothetical protein